MRDIRSYVLIPVLLLVAGAPFAGSRTSEQLHSYFPKEGFVPNESTAIRIAEAVLSPIYGEDQIAKERPFAAVLKDGVWTVEGHLSTPNGGVALAEITKKDGRILRVTHGK
jgi:NTF2 fold immunity protein